MLAIALPMVVSGACETVLIFTDRLFLSRLGSVPMSAAMAGGLTSFMLMTFFIGLTGYATARWSPSTSARAGRVTASWSSPQAVFLSFLATLILAARPLAHDLFAVMDIPRSSSSSRSSISDILLYGAILVLLRNCLSSFFSGIGQTRVVMFSALTAMLVNVAANYVLIFGHLGFPAPGIRGRPTAPLRQPVRGAAGRLSGAKPSQEFGVALPRYDGEVMRKLLRFGYPAGELFLNLLAFTSMILLFHFTASPRRRPSPSSSTGTWSPLCRCSASRSCRQPGRALQKVRAGRRSPSA